MPSLRRTLREHDELIMKLAQTIHAAEQPRLDARTFMPADEPIPESAPLAWLKVTGAGRVIDWNDSARRLLGPLKQDQPIPELTAQLSQAQPPCTCVELASETGAFELFDAVQLPNRNWQLTHIQPSSSTELAATLSRLWGLTPAENQLAIQLLAGLTTQEIAATQGRTVGGVRQSIKSILSKLRVSTQPQAVARIAAVQSALIRRRFAKADKHPERFRIDGEHVANVWRWGLRGGQPVLFFHGALYGVLGQPDFANQAYDFGLDMVALERPGYGNTPLPADTDPVSLAVELARQLVDRVGMQRVSVLAHDVGTVYAMAFAHRYPDRVAGIVCSPTTPPMLGWSQTSDMPPTHRVAAWAAQTAPGVMSAMIRHGIARIQRQGVSAIPSLFFADSTHDRSVLESLPYRSVLEHVYEYSIEQGAAGFLADMFVTNRDWSDWLAHIPCSCVLLHGADSRTVSRQAVQKMAASLARARFELVAQAGHTLPLTQPTLALRLLLTAKADEMTSSES